MQTGNYSGGFLPCTLDVQTRQRYKVERSWQPIGAVTEEHMQPDLPDCCTDDVRWPGHHSHARNTCKRSIILEQSLAGCICLLSVDCSISILHFPYL